MAEFIPGLICEACKDPIKRGEKYTMIRDLPTGALHQFHAEHAPNSPEQNRPPRHLTLDAEPGGPLPEKF